MADTCKNCAKCGKDFKIGTNKAHNIEIKIRLGGISKIFCFCSHANMAASDRHFTEEEILEKVFTHKLSVIIGRSSQNSSKMTLEPC